MCLFLCLWCGAWCRQEALEAVRKAEVEGAAEGRAAVAEDIARSSAEAEARLEELRSQLEGFRQQADEHCGRVERQVGVGLFLAVLGEKLGLSLLGERNNTLSQKERGPYVVKDVEGEGCFLTQEWGAGRKRDGSHGSRQSAACHAFRA